MVFTSYLFIFAFLPCFLAAYYLIPHRARSLLILFASCLFYGWWRPESLLLLLGVITVTHQLTRKMASCSSTLDRRRWLVIGVTVNLALLGYFKYFNFTIDSLNVLLTSLGRAPLSFVRLALPIGLSFFIFQAISYQVDVYRGDAPPTRNLADFAAFISFFPQLVAGPVLRYQPLAEQFHTRAHSWWLFGDGALLFMAGFTGKVLIADTLDPLVHAAFTLASPSLADSWLGTAAYSIQLFFDFSGYSSMAVGLGLMVGFHFPKNFDDPYHATSVTDFWRRWHISLSTWLREYLYIPLGGNRAGPIRNYGNLILTMLLGGLWHGANWTFLWWGAWHGVLLAGERLWREKSRRAVPRLATTPLTLLLVMFGWVLFRSPSMHMATKMWRAMIGLSPVSNGLSPEFAWQVRPEQQTAILVGIAVAALLPRLRKAAGPARLLIIPPFLWALSTLAAQSFTPFLYFQF